MDTDLYIGDVPPRGFSKLGSSNTLQVSESKKSVMIIPDSDEKKRKQSIFKKRNNSIQLPKIK